MADISKTQGIRIRGIGRYVPEMIATNEDFTKIVETSDEWITQRTGIKTRHITNGEPTYYLGAMAAKEAVAKAAQCVVPMPEHFHMEIDFVKHHVAYSKSFYPGATLKDDKFVCFDSDDWYEVLRFCHFVLSDG